MFGQSLLYGRVLVRGVAVGNQVQFLLFGCLPFNFFHEFQQVVLCVKTRFQSTSTGPPTSAAEPSLTLPRVAKSGISNPPQ